MSGQATLLNSFLYEQTDVPMGMTLKDWRIASAKPARKSRIGRTGRRLRRGVRPDPVPRLA
jgi:hypothetical protein